MFLFIGRLLLLRLLVFRLLLMLLLLLLLLAPEHIRVFLLDRVAAGLLRLVLARIGLKLVLTLQIVMWLLEFGT